MKSCKFFKILLLFVFISSYFLSGHSLLQASYPKKVRYEVVFEGEMFDLYYQQLLQSLKNFDALDNLENQKKEQLRALFSLPVSTLEQKKEFYHQLVGVLRQPIELKTSEFTNIDSFSRWFYTEAKLLPAYEHFLQSFLPDVKDRDLPSLIQECYDKIASYPQFSGSSRDNTMGYKDENYEGYVPSYLYEAFSTRFILTPRVTFENTSNHDVKVNSIFLNYLLTLKQQNKKHLYINLMSRNGDERTLSKCIENLSKEDIFRGVIYTATIDKASDFYWQRKAFAEPEIDSTKFKALLMHEMFEKTDEESLFKWPDQLDPVAWKQTVQQLIDQMHAELFNHQETFSLKTREDFIEILYVKIIQKLCELCQPDYANASCYFTADRGPSVLSLVYASSCLEQKGAFTDEEKKMSLILFYGPPMLNHHRSSHDYRVRRIKGAIEVLQKNHISVLTEC